jgi:hypothetical protein
MQRATTSLPDEAYVKALALSQIEHRPLSNWIASAVMEKIAAAEGISSDGEGFGSPPAGS